MQIFFKNFPLFKFELTHDTLHISMKTTTTQRYFLNIPPTLSLSAEHVQSDGREK